MFLLSKNSKLAFLGAIPDPLYEIGSLFSILTIAKQSPPIPVEFGSTTDKQIDAAIAASTAFPPFFRILRASSVASGCEVAAIAFAEIESEFLLDFINKFYRINLI